VLPLHKFSGEARKLLICLVSSFGNQLFRPQTVELGVSMCPRQISGHEHPLPLAYDQLWDGCTLTPDHGENMFHAGAHLDLVAILRALGFVDFRAAAHVPVGKVLGLRRFGLDQRLLAGVGAVAVNAPLAAVQQLRQRVLVVRFGRCHHSTVCQPGAASRRWQRHIKEPLLSLARVTSLVGVLRRAWHADDGGLHDPTGAYLQPARERTSDGPHDKVHCHVVVNPSTTGNFNIQFIQSASSTENRKNRSLLPIKSLSGVQCVQEADKA
jgi:hypothetical protein